VALQEANEVLRPVSRRLEGLGSSRETTACRCWPFATRR